MPMTISKDRDRAEIYYCKICGDTVYQSYRTCVSPECETKIEWVE